VLCQGEHVAQSGNHEGQSGLVVLDGYGPVGVSHHATNVVICKSFAVIIKYSIIANFIRQTPHMFRALAECRQKKVLRYSMLQAFQVLKLLMQL
jgi:hypothetical protein